MEPPKNKMNEDGEYHFFYCDGILYFSRKTERLVFFVLTMIMLGLGILTKLGLF